MARKKPPVIVSSPVPTFSLEGPPKDWERQHDRGSFSFPGGAAYFVNHPVPRNASCHFYARDTARANVYFY